MIKLKSLISENRKLGKALNKTGYAYKYVEIFRAIPVVETGLKPNDYVTRSKKFAIEHSDHQTAVHEELYHVMRYIVKAENVFQAYNTDEYFYNGPDVAGIEIYKSTTFLQENLGLWNNEMLNESIDKRHEKAAKIFIYNVWRHMPKDDRLSPYQFTLWMESEESLSELKEKLANQLYPNNNEAQETFIEKDVEPALEKIIQSKYAKVAKKIDPIDPLFVLKSVVRRQTYETAKQSLMKMFLSGWGYEKGKIIQDTEAESMFNRLYRHAMGETYYDVKMIDGPTLSSLNISSADTTEKMFIQRYAGWNEKKFPDKVKVWRGTNSPLNAIKAGDFVTFDRDYAESYVRGKYGAVISSILSSSELKIFKMDINSTQMVYWPENHQRKIFTGTVPSFKEFWQEFH